MIDPYQEAAASLSTLRDVLRFAVSRFNEAELAFGHGFPSALEEARYLLLHSLRLPQANFDWALAARLTPSELRAALDLVRRRVSERVPAAYLTHEAWLGDYRFYVDERVIVPRSFIAELLRDGLTPWVADREAVADVLDLCTGSGCLAIVAAMELVHASVDAVDLSADALSVAERNVRDYELDDRIRLLQSDLFDALKGKKYDLIVSNPPYVTAAAMQRLPQEYRREPQLALAGGADGLDYVRKILTQARRHLKPGGVLVLEVGDNRAALERAFPRLPFTWPQTVGGDECVFLLPREDLA